MNFLNKNKLTVRSVCGRGLGKAGRLLNEIQKNIVRTLLYIQKDIHSLTAWLACMACFARSACFLLSLLRDVASCRTSETVDT